MNKEFERELHSFPSPFIRAIENSQYSKGESQFSVTQLLSPPQRTWLSMNAEKHEDAYGAFMALLGTAMHSILEKNARADLGEIAELRLFHDFKIGDSHITVSGQLDFYESKTIYDYKLTGGIQDKAKPEHYMQAQMNGYLANSNHIETEHVAICYIQRDWSYMKKILNPTYPQSPFRIFIHEYDHDAAAESFKTTIGDHLTASMGKPRPCTLDEQWAKPDSFAIMKNGASRATKLYDSLSEAEEALKPGYYIQTRKGEKTYCENFCGFKHICSQYKAELEFSKDEF